MACDGVFASKSGVFDGIPPAKSVKFSSRVPKVTLIEGREGLRKTTLREPVPLARFQFSMNLALIELLGRRSIPHEDKFRSHTHHRPMTMVKRLGSMCCSCEQQDARAFLGVIGFFRGILSPKIVQISLRAPLALARRKRSHS